MKFIVHHKADAEDHYQVWYGTPASDGRYCVENIVIVRVKKSAVFSSKLPDETAEESNRRWYEDIQLGEVWELKPAKKVGGR